MLTRKPVIKGLRGLLLCGAASVALAACTTTTTAAPSNPLPTYALPYTPPPAPEAQTEAAPETAPVTDQAAMPDDGSFEQLGDASRLTGSLNDFAGRES